MAEKALLQTHQHSSPTVHVVKSRSLHRKRKFVSTIVEGLRQTPGVSFLGKDRDAARILRYFTAFSDDLSIHRISVVGQAVTVVGIPNSIWYDRQAMLGLGVAIDHFVGYGHPLVTAPQRAVEALASADAPAAGDFFRDLIEAALARGTGSDMRCGMRIRHDSTGCLAVKIATGSPCQH